MVLDKAQLAAWLADWCDPHTQQPVQLIIDGQDNQGLFRCRLRVAYPPSFLSKDWLVRFQTAFFKAFQIENGVIDLQKTIDVHVAQAGIAPLPQVKNVIAVASGKGGVGKSTTAVNLALALQQSGARVAIVDADIHGPSVPMMLGLCERPEVIDEKMMQPLLFHGVQANSIGLLVDVKQPIIWRGPMVVSALEQLFKQTAWQAVDYLIVDLPPGTGDIQLSLAQRIPLSGVVIVTTPQDIALLDVQKALNMFKKMQIPILGVVENMGVHVCSQCGHHEHIFGQDGGQQFAQAHQIPILGSLPLDKRIREQADVGVPIVVADSSGKLSKYYVEISKNVCFLLADQVAFKQSKFPEIKIYPV